MRESRVGEQNRFFCGNLKNICCSFKTEQQDDLLGRYFNKKRKAGHFRASSEGANQRHNNDEEGSNVALRYE